MAKGYSGTSRADSALYRAKGRGRNRVVNAADVKPAKDEDEDVAGRKHPTSFQSLSS
jgi:hypothetical protein